MSLVRRSRKAAAIPPSLPPPVLGELLEGGELLNLSIVLADGQLLHYFTGLPAHVGIRLPGEAARRHANVRVRTPEPNLDTFNCFITLDPAETGATLGVGTGSTTADYLQLLPGGSATIFYRTGRTPVVQRFGPEPVPDMPAPPRNVVSFDLEVGEPIRLTSIFVATAFLFAAPGQPVGSHFNVTVGSPGSSRAVFTNVIVFAADDSSTLTVTSSTNGSSVVIPGNGFAYVHYANNQSTVSFNNVP